MLTCWWRSALNDATTNYSKDMGQMSLSDVSVPADWDGGPEQDLAALEVGHVYVVKCHDGYAAFEVKSVDAASTEWPVTVEYRFTAGSSF